jgi:hypothetical protein
MKKIVLSAAFLFGLGLAAVYAEEPDINARAKEAFQNQFPAAENQEWSAGSDYYKVNFLYNGNFINAFYSPEGEFIATIRNISSVNLPVMLQTGLKNNYDGYWITELYEMARQDGNSYFITLENADKKIVLKSSNGISWTAHKKAAKT